MFMTPFGIEDHNKVSAIVITTKKAKKMGIKRVHRVSDSVTAINVYCIVTPLPVGIYTHTAFADDVDSAETLTLVIDSTTTTVDVRYDTVAR